MNPEIPKLPPAYRWLGMIDPLPRMLAEALRLLGTVERVGPGDAPEILGWARELGGDVMKLYRSDAMPWCGLFMAVVAQRAGKAVPASPLWALSWAGFGAAADRASLGDVLVFRRPGGGGHVGLYVGEDAGGFHVLGGNQSDRVGFARLARGRLVAARRPAYRVAPACVRPCHLDAANADLSRNEG